jgi:hypothetical protein
MSPDSNDVRSSTAGKTAQKPSQYRHALHTVSRIDLVRESEAFGHRQKAVWGDHAAVVVL